MKRIFDNLKSQARQNWQKVMNSTKHKMSQGAEFVYKLMSSAHGDNWRRKESKKPKND